MTIRDDQFMQTLLAAFRDEAEEHLHTLSASLLELEKPTGTAPASAVIERGYREAHSLKGAARAVNRLDVEQICQATESVLAGWKNGAALPPTDGFDALHRTVDRLREWVAMDTPAPETQVTALAQTITALLALPDAAPVPRTPAEAIAAVVRDAESAGAAGREPGEALVRAASPPALEPAGTPATVRIATAKLDSLLLGLEEMLAIKLAARRRTAELRALVEESERWPREWARLQAELNRQRALGTGAGGGTGNDAAAALAGTRQLPPAVTEFLEWNRKYVLGLSRSVETAARAAQQDRHAVGKLIDDLRDESKRLLMLPFATLLGQIPKQVRDLCREQGKDAQVMITGGENEIDKRILEQVKDPLIHLIRNCVDHGLETADRRLAAGKPACGTLALAVSPLEGGHLELLVGDDGAGIDLEQVKASALSLGVVTPTELATLGEQEALALIFRSGVSTRTRVSELSGRGLGLAIVRENVENLGGRVAVETRPGRGTVFRLTLPLSLAALRGLLIEVAGRTLALPTAAVERVARVRSSDIRTAANRETLVLDGRALALVRLDRVLGLPPGKPSAGMASDTFVTLVVLGAGERRVAFVVDGVLAEEELLVKPFRRPLVRVRNLAGATVLATGEAVPVLNVADLLRSAVSPDTRAAAPAAEATATTARAPKRVLLVEDSITARMLLKDILEGSGYRVQTAVDGMDAWTRLRTAEFDAVVSDVEMPRLNGLDLTARIRADPGLTALPVILVTALASTADRERGVDAGANAYVVKDSFDQNQLLELLARMV